MPIPYSLVRDESGRRTLTIFLPSKLVTVNDDHANFEKLAKALQQETITSEQEIITLADYSAAISDKFESLSDRVSVKGGEVYFDNDPIDNSISKHIIRCLDADEDWISVVNFLEKVSTNPDPNSREQLYNWLNIHDFTITYEGDIIGYKGVKESSDEEAQYESLHSGRAIVNGVEQRNSVIKQNIGDVVEMPRSQVNHDPDQGCSYGLHVGTHDYAKGYGSIVLEVVFNPRDVVSVPNDSGYAKLRTCRYHIVDVANEAKTQPIWNDEDGYYSDEYPDSERCDDPSCPCNDPY